MNASVVDRVYDWLMDAMRRGVFAPGDPLREETIATELKVSRTPVREALRRLQAEGLVATGPRRGVIVREPPYDELSELCVIREALESLAARLAAGSVTSAELYLLEELSREMEQSFRDGDVATLARLNAEFHAVIWRASRNRYLARQLDRIRLLIARRQGTTLTYPGRAEEALGEHRELLDAIKRGDAERAAHIAHQHMARAHMIRMRMNRGAAATASTGA
ncbi:MAG: GntR family transcriptional regulator [Armatimonadota bacterium]|nr:GntR family transcriptional regulator [Armatimonadota bacterium]MDR7531775.1 GntR family transcriptional regulator [Armatimonadota bacterium]